MSIFSDRRPLRQIGGLRAYLQQVAWSIWWRLEPLGGRPNAAARRLRPRRTAGRPSDPDAGPERP